jgi:ribosomal protein S18 acetylase RimI-like enzyme
MNRPPLSISVRPATADDLPALQRIRAAAFAPVFASFRAMLGDTLYERVQARDDEAQHALLASLVERDSGWELHVAEAAGAIVGFVSLRLDHARQVGEIGLNAVHPAHANRGVGTAMYRFALARMTDAGMQAATVSTGGDASHAAARRAYEKAGFSAHIPSVWLCRTL